MKDVSVIIVNYNTKELTYNCINSIRESTVGCSYEIILVDNASTDGSRELFSEIEGIKYIYNNQNIGFGRANNLGAQYASGKYCFFLNSDTILLNDAISILFEYEEKSDLKNHFATGCQLLDADMNPIHSGGPFPETWHTLCKVMHIKKEYGEGTDNTLDAVGNYQIVGYVTGADMLVRKDSFNSLNGFDPSFFMYFEETDLQKRASEKGMVNVLLQGPKIVHLEGASFSNVQTFVSFKRRYANDKSMFLYFKKHTPYCKYFCFRLFFLLLRLPFLLDFRYGFSERIKYIALLFSYVAVTEEHDCK